MAGMFQRELMHAVFTVWRWSTEQDRRARMLIQALVAAGVPISVDPNNQTIVVGDVPQQVVDQVVAPSTHSGQGDPLPPDASTAVPDSPMLESDEAED